MPWSDRNNGGGGPWQSGGGGGGQGPWGGGGRGGGGGGEPPNLDDLFRKGSDRLRDVIPGGPMGGRGIFLAIMVILGLWGMSGFYQVDTTQVGVVMRFGKFNSITQPGLRYHLPWPFEVAYTPNVTQVNQVDVGFRSAGSEARRSGRDIPAESLMLTGDENIIDIDFSVQWRIANAPDYLFNVRDPDVTVKAVAESAMREVIGRSTILQILTKDRQRIVTETADLMQTILDDYGAGILITEIQLQEVDPPKQVIEAFRDVQAARADKERLQNEAEAYANDIVPRARGEAEKIKQIAKAYKEQQVKLAEGESQRFVALLVEYAQNKDVMRRRLFLETMEDIYSNSDKTLINTPGSSGAQPFLPIPLNSGRSGEVK